MHTLNIQRLKTFQIYLHVIYHSKGLTWRSQILNITMIGHSHVKNKHKSKKYILRGQRNARYYDRILSNKKKATKSTKIYNFTTKSFIKRYMTSDPRDRTF